MGAQSGCRMSGVVEAALWALALVVLFSVFIDLVWVLTGTLESLCEPLFVCCRRGASDEERPICLPVCGGRRARHAVRFGAPSRTGLRAGKATKDMRPEGG
jgi:hypothetical protein